MAARKPENKMNRTTRDKRTWYTITRYSAFWERQVEIYGFTSYHSAILHLMGMILEESHKTNKNNRLLECAVGTGYPLGNRLRKQGWEVHGIDIAFSLLKKWKSNDLKENIDCKTLAVQSDVRHLPYYSEAFFTTCCFQSTWYISDLERAIEEMFRVTLPGGYVIFDIMNLLNWSILKNHIKRFLRNKAHLIMRHLVSKNSDDLVIHEWGHLPFMIARILRGRSSNISVYDPHISSSEKGMWSGKWNSSRRLYVCRKRY